MDAARQRLAQARRLAACAAVALLAGCGSSAPSGGPTLRLALPLLPATLDPAKAADLPSLNVAHELYAGLTRFSRTGVQPDLAQSWDVEQGGLVWTFHLRKGIHWSDGTPIVAADFRRAWVHAISPQTGAAYAGPALGIVRGSRHFHATGRGDIGVQALGPRTLRVTLQHPVPWFDELVAYPIAFPQPPHPGDSSGPFRLASRSATRLVLARNRSYWNASAVKPARLVLTTSTAKTDAILPRGTAPPGLPWVETAKPSAGPGWTKLPTLSVHLLWLVTRRPELANPGDRAAIAAAVGDATLNSLVPVAMPGRDAIVSNALVTTIPLTPGRLTLAYTTQDAQAAATVPKIEKELAADGVSVTPVAFPTLATLVHAAGPPARNDLDLVLLGWTPKIFDAYNLLDLFPCGSAFNVAQWCDPSYDALMRQAVRTLDPAARYQVEGELLSSKLRPAVPAVPLGGQDEYVHLAPGVHGFSWSPIGFYELDGMTRS